MDKKKRTDTVSELIIQMILDNDMEPGEKLPNETELSKTLSVSRSTLREAVRRLESRNIVTIKQGSGTYISDKNGIPEDPLGLTMLYGLKNIRDLALDLIDTRIILEPEIAAIAAQHISNQQIEVLIQKKEAVDESIQRVNTGEYSYEQHLDSEVSFHGYIAECSGNGVFQNLIPVITSSIRMAITTWDDELRGHAIQQHDRIARSICNRDPIGARSAMISHLLPSREFYILENQNKKN